MAYRRNRVDSSVLITEARANIDGELLIKIVVPYMFQTRRRAAARSIYLSCDLVVSPGTLSECTAGQGTEIFQNRR